MMRALSFTALVAFAPMARADEPCSCSLGDEYFAMRAYADGMAEVAKSKLAREKAADAGVKAFAEKMVEDHTECNEKIAELAKKKGITLPTAIDPIHATAIGRLAKLSGSDFDKAYMMAQIGAHKSALLLFGHEERQGEDPELKELAHKALPHLEHHAKAAFEVAGEKQEGEKFCKIHEYAKQVMNEK